MHTGEVNELQIRMVERLPIDLGAANHKNSSQVCHARHDAGDRRGKAVDASDASGKIECRVHVITTLMRPASGRNLGGIDCHVLRPMTTAFRNPAKAAPCVRRLK